MTEHITVQYVATWEDRSQVLITVWSDGAVTAAKREDRSAIWGPPTEEVEVEH